MWKLRVRSDLPRIAQLELKTGSQPELQAFLCQAEFCVWALLASQQSMHDKCFSHPAKSNASLNISLPLFHLHAFSPAWNAFLSSIYQLQFSLSSEPCHLLHKDVSIFRSFSSFEPRNTWSVPQYSCLFGPISCLNLMLQHPSCWGFLQLLAVPCHLWVFASLCAYRSAPCPAASLTYYSKFSSGITSSRRPPLTSPTPNSTIRSPSSVMPWYTEDTSVMNKIVHSFTHSFIIARWRLWSQTSGLNPSFKVGKFLTTPPCLTICKMRKTIVPTSNIVVRIK